MNSFYLVVDLQPATEEDLEVLLNEMRTTREEEPVLLDRFTVIGPLDVHELGEEMFMLGTCFERIETQHDIVFPFDFVVLPEKPTDADELDLLFEAKQALQIKHSS